MTVLCPKCTGPHAKTPGHEGGHTRERPQYCPDCPSRRPRVIGHIGPHSDMPEWCPKCSSRSPRILGHEGPHSGEELTLTCGHIGKYFIGTKGRWGRCQLCKAVVNVRMKGHIRKPTKSEWSEAMLIDMTAAGNGEVGPHDDLVAATSVSDAEGQDSAHHVETPIETTKGSDRHDPSPPVMGSHEHDGAGCTCCLKKSGEACVRDAAEHWSRLGSRGPCGCCLRCQLEW